MNLLIVAGIQSAGLRPSEALLGNGLTAVLFLTGAALLLFAALLLLRTPRLQHYIRKP